MKDQDLQSGMNYLVSVPRRVVTVYIPLCVFLFVLLFPFYWMAITAVKPNAELLSTTGNPFWVIRPLEHFELLFHTPTRAGCGTP
jgi:multiple sugar transport system permease protein